MRKATACLISISCCSLFLFLAATVCIHAAAPAGSRTGGSWIDMSTNVPCDPLLNLLDIHFVGPYGWIVGGVDVVYYTPDGGHTFSSHTLPAGSGITTAICMRSADEGYIVTAGGKFLHSTDARHGNWQLLAYHTSVRLNAIHFPPLPATTAYAGGNSGLTFRINGDTVTSLGNISTVAWTGLSFPVNSDEGWVCGESNLRHWDESGWAEDQSYDSGLNYISIYMVDNLRGWMVGDEGCISYTVNGYDWNGQESPTTANLFDVFFLDANEGWAVGESTILHTTDGLHWQVEAAGLTTGRILRAVFAVGSNAVYVVGNHRTLLKYGSPSQNTHLPLIVK